jgi:transposase
VRPPAVLTPWLTEARLRRWVHDAPTAAAYRQRLAVWLTVHGGQHAAQVGDAVQASARTVRRWLARYDALGPGALQGERRGGRHWAYLSEADERALLGAVRRRAAEGRILTAGHLRAIVEAHVGRPVSTTYLYRLLARHDWRKLAPRPRHVRADVAAQAAFKKTSPPCSAA